MDVFSNLNESIDPLILEQSAQGLKRAYDQVSQMDIPVWKPRFGKDSPDYAKWMSSVDDINPEDIFFKEDVHDWVQEEHKVMLVLLNTQYLRCRLDSYEGWRLKCQVSDLEGVSKTRSGMLPPWIDENNQLNSEHTALYQKGNDFLICCRGTQIGKAGGMEDVMDDLLIGFGLINLINFVFGNVDALFNAGAKVAEAVGLGPFLSQVLEYWWGLGQYGQKVGKGAINYGAKKTGLAQLHERVISGCEFISKQSASAVVNSLLARGVPPANIKICGHSLGGRAAVCTSVQYNLAECVVFNMASPVTNPIQEGLGPGRCTHYHICGDLISTHTDDVQMRTVRKLIETSSVAEMTQAKRRYKVVRVYDPKVDHWVNKTMAYGDYKTSFSVKDSIADPILLMTETDIPNVSITESCRFDMIVHHALKNFTKAIPVKQHEPDANEYDTMLYFWAGTADWNYLYGRRFQTDAGERIESGIVSMQSIIEIFHALIYHVIWETPIPGTQRAYWKMMLKTCGGSNLPAFANWFGLGDLRYRLACIKEELQNDAINYGLTEALTAIVPALVTFAPLFMTIVAGVLATGSILYQQGQKGYY